MVGLFGKIFKHMERVIINTNHVEQSRRDRVFWSSQTPEQRLNAVELLRLEAGEFMYEYPARFQRVISITRKT